MEDFVTFEIAKKLKEKGFREECLCYYIGKDLFYNIESPITNNQLWFSHNNFDNIWHRDNYDAPTILQALKWLREEKEIDLVIDPLFYENRRREYSIHVFTPWLNKPVHCGYFNKWEQAAIAGIEYVLDNLI